MQTPIEDCTPALNDVRTDRLEVAQVAPRGEVGFVRIEQSSPPASSHAGFVRLDGRAAGTELLRLAACVLELRARIGVDELTRLDSLEPVPL